MTKHPILSGSISQLSVSDEFLAMARENHFNSLEDLLKLPSNNLLRLPLFGYRIFNELLTILQDNGLESELKDH